MEEWKSTLAVILQMKLLQWNDLSAKINTQGFIQDCEIGGGNCKWALVLTAYEPSPLLSLNHICTYV